MATNSPYQIASLLDKMSSSDKDFRYMATNDLMNELQNDSIKLDDDRERLVVQSLLRLLEDKNGEVQNLAVKCLGPLVKKVKEYQVEWIVDTLCTNMASKNEQLRDVSSIGLKTVISELPAASSPLSSSICKRITGKLTDAITKTQDQSVQLEALDILADLLNRFGALLVSFHSSIMKCTLPLLKSQRMAIRKRTIIALAQLVMCASNQLFVELMDYLIDELKSKKTQLDVRTFIQCIGSICRQSGHKVGPYLDQIIPEIVSYSKLENDDELRETCIQSFESFICKCPKEVTSYIQQINELCLEYLCYDPNYNYGDENEDDGDAMDTNDIDEDDELDSDEEEYSDDDDMSWKVRRSSAKCLGAVFRSRHELLKEFYSNISPKLIARFKEREENVKSDIFNAFIALLRQTRPLVPADSKQEDDSPLKMLEAQLPMVIKSLSRQMQEKSVKTRQGCFALLTELVSVLSGALTNHIQSIIPGILFSLNDRSSSSNMKIDALSFLGVILQQHEPSIFYPYIPKLVPVLVASIKDPFYKIAAEALSVTQNMIRVLRPMEGESTFDHNHSDHLTIITEMYEAILLRLQAADIDQEVKEKSITCMGQLLSNAGDNLTARLPQCLPIFLDRLKNEITRLTTVRAVIMIAESPLRLDLSLLLSDAVPLLSSFLRKNHRALKLTTLTCLITLTKNHSQVMTAVHYQSILTELPALVNDADLHISQLALNLVTPIIKKEKSMMNVIRSDLLPEALKLTQSPLLQGAALNSMVTFLTELVRSSQSGFQYKDLLRILTAPIYDKSDPDGSVLHKMAFHSIAKCVAALSVTCRQEADEVVTRFVQHITSSSSDSVRMFSLLAVGEIGAHIDLSERSQLKDVIIASFQSESEDIKSAASYSLGHVSVGNLNAFLPFILQEIEANPKRQYLLLHSLKEIISWQSSKSGGIEALKPFLPAIWKLLFSNCENYEEGTRNVVAECLGKLALLDPANLLQQLQEHLSSNSPQMRSTVITAFKFTIIDQPQTIDPYLSNYLQFFLRPIVDPDLNVRRVALTTLNSAAHNKPSLIRDILPDILPHLYSETKVRKELIREVEMGPFKHTVDDGLDIRKAAFECMYTLLDSCLDRLNIFEFLNHVEIGLKDHYDIKMLTYLMLVRLSGLCPNAVLQHLDRIVEPLRSTVQSKVKANSVKQEYEKQDELKRSALRAISALCNIPDASIHPMLSDFLSQIRASADTAAMFESVRRDPSSASSSTDVAMEIGSPKSQSTTRLGARK